MLVPFVGCKKKVTDTMTNGEWLTELTTQAGITSYQQEEPYFLNILLIRHILLLSNHLLSGNY